MLADLADPAGPASLIGEAGDRIDVLVNNVGGAPARTAGFLSITDADWHATSGVNQLHQHVCETTEYWDYLHDLLTEVANTSIPDVLAEPVDFLLNQQSWAKALWAARKW